MPARISNLNETFQECFEYFYNGMEKPWNPSEGFKVPRTRFDDKITFVASADNTITPNNTLHILVNENIKMSMFQEQYEGR